MSAKFRKAAAAVLVAFVVVADFACDQDPFRDDLTNDLISPWCSIGAPATWEGKPCVVPLRVGSADITPAPR